MNDDTDKRERITPGDVELSDEDFSPAAVRRSVMMSEEALAVIAAWRANAHPGVIAKVDEMLRACRYYAAKNSAADAELIPGFEALLQMAKVLV